jgi:hypothetical protein
MSRSARSALLRRQLRWARAAGCRLDPQGYAARLEDNLRTAALPATLAAFDRPGTSELAPGRVRPARILALHSSAALVINVFEPWCERDAAPLLRALGIAASGATLQFERPLPTGLEGDPPYIDVALELDSGQIVAIESKFTEWLTPRPRHCVQLKQKYFAAPHWAQCGLARCQALAEDLQARAERFKHLNAAQLLKHALALARSGRAGSLYYLYYDLPGPESNAHRAEIERFRARAAPELDLASATYQELFRTLRDDPRVDRDYVDYLGERYFGASA